MDTLTLTQEYYLCSIGDKGRYPALDMERGICLVAAGMLELMLGKAVALEGEKLSVLRPLPEESACLEELYQLIRREQPVKVLRVLESFLVSISDNRLRELLGAVGASLVPAGAARPEKGGLFGGRTLYVPDEAWRDRVVQNLRAELLEDGALSDEGAALAALLHKSGVIGRYFSAYEKKALKERLKELKDRPDNQLVGRMIEYIEDLMALAVVAST